MTEPAGHRGGQGGREGAGPSDAMLLQRHVDGDIDAFGILVARHRDRLWAVALRTLGDPEDAADALQDALVSAYRRAGTFRGDAAVTTWLHRVVVNACLDLLRRRRARPVDSVDSLDDPDLDRAAPDHGAGAAPDPERSALQGEQRSRVLAALASLPDEQRAALVLVDMEGWSVADAAQVLGCATGTVKSRCARGRARLAPQLRDLHPASGPARNRDGASGVRPEEPSVADQPTTQPAHGTPLPASEPAGAERTGRMP